MITVVSPQRALRRAQARMALDVVSKTRRYEAGRLSDRTRTMRRDMTSANGSIAYDLHNLRASVRDGVRNSGFIRQAQEVWVSNAVGEGIRPSFDNQQIRDAFSWFSDEVDADGNNDFYGLQSLVSRAEWESGEGLVRYRPRRLSDGLHVPFQIQILEPDYIDTSLNKETENGYIINGVEYDRIGRRINYWLFPEHPGEAFSARRSFQARPVSARDVFSVYRPLRPGQVRGVPAIAASLLQFHDLSEYADAEMTRKKIEACFSVFITDPESSGINVPDPAGMAGNTTGATRIQPDGQQVDMISPGIIARLKPGQEIETASPTQSGEYSQFREATLLECAAGAQLTYAQLTGDLRGANYSSLRAGLVQFRTSLRPYRRQQLIFQFCKRVEREFYRYGVMAGLFPKPAKKALWIPPHFDPVDPVKDILADVAAMRAGLKTYKQLVTEYGLDYAEAIKDIVEVNKDLDDNEIILDSDPRRTSKSGIVQSLENLNKD